MQTYKGCYKLIGYIRCQIDKRELKKNITFICTDLNSYVEDLFNIKAEGLIGKNINDIKDPSLKNLFSWVHHEINPEIGFNGEEFQVDIHDGKISCSVYFIDNTSFIILLVPPHKLQDDSNEISTSEFELSGIKEALFNSYIVSIADRRGIIVNVNEKFIEVSGYTKNELVGSNHNIINSGHHSREFWLNMWKTISRGNNWRNDVCNRAKDGSLYWVDTFISPVLNSSGEITEYISIRSLITERVLDQDKLSKLLKKMTLATHFAQLGVWEWDILNNKLEWDDNMYRIYNTDQNNFIPNYEGWFELVHIKDQERVLKEIKKSLNEDIELSISFRVTTKEGVTRYIKSSAIVEYSASNRPIRMTGICQDITQAVQSEKLSKLNLALRAKPPNITDLNSYFNNIMNELLDFMDSEYGFMGEVLYDKGVPYLKTYAITDISWSPETKALYKKHASLGMEFRNMKTLFGYAITRKILIISNNPATDDRRGGLPAGHPALDHFIGIPVFDALDNMIGLIGLANKTNGYFESDAKILASFIDNFANVIKAIQNERSKLEIEHKLDESSKRLNSIIIGANIGTWDFNLITGKVDVNERWADIVGYTLEEIGEMSIDIWNTCCHPDDLMKRKYSLEEHIKGESDYYDCEYRMKHKNGSWVWVLDRGKIYEYSDNGRPTLMSGTYQDITANKKLESSIKDLTTKDYLTGIYNRMHMLKLIEIESFSVLNNKENFSLVLMDIDYFKNINDLHGHLAGDFILIEFSKIMLQNIRSNELFGRYGGEEFLLLMKNCNKENAVKRISKILSAIKSTVFPYRGVNIAFTISCGVIDTNEFSVDHINAKVY